LHERDALLLPALTPYTPHLQNKVLYAPLSEADPVVQNIIDKETWRQFSGLELIASEVRTWPVSHTK
jgi:hypothetical protein